MISLFTVGTLVEVTHDDDNCMVTRFGLCKMQGKTTARRLGTKLGLGPSYYTTKSKIHHLHDWVYPQEYLLEIMMSYYNPCDGDTVKSDGWRLWSKKKVH